MEISVEEIMKASDKLRSSKSPGPHGTHARVLKELKPKTVDLLILVCNLQPPGRTSSASERWKPCGERGSGQSSLDRPCTHILPLSTHSLPLGDAGF